MGSWGKLVNGSKLIHDQICGKDYTFMQYSESLVYIKVPRPGMEICFINVKDLWNDGTAEIACGGIGRESVTVKMTSQFGRGFKFHIQVSASPEPQCGSGSSSSDEN